MRARGFTLLEMIVATAIMAIAVVGLLSGLAGAARNAARLRDYDRATQLAQLRMNELLVDQAFPRNATVDGVFDPSLSGGLESGWRARVSAYQMSPAPYPGQLALDRVELEVWWKAGDQRRTLALSAYRERVLKPDDIPQRSAP